MNALWYTDGTDRRQWARRREVGYGPEPLEQEYRVLMGRVMEMAGGIRYFGVDNKPGGYWRELFRFQPLAVLNEIVQVNVVRMEEGFLKCCERRTEMATGMVKELCRCLEDWEKRLVYYPGLLLTQDLKGRAKFPVPEATERLRTVKQSFYGVLETVRMLQANEEHYLQEIRSCGENDPALALLDVFLRHYGEVAACFNRRWDGWAGFYFRRVLRACCRDAVADRTWLAFGRMPGGGEVIVPGGTAFTAGRNEEGKPVCYRSLETVRVEEGTLERVRTFYPEKDPDRFPAARLGFVTSVWEQRLQPEGSGPQRLFGGSEGVRLPLGLMIESPMLVMKEGRRTLRVTFGLTEESGVFFRQLTEQVAAGDGEKPEEASGRLLKDAFLLSLSTEEGWTEVPGYAAVQRQGEIMLAFTLGKEYLPVVAAGAEQHGLVTRWPVLRLQMNPDAWLFPYSWMAKVKCERVKLQVEAVGLTALKIYGGMGEVDISAPFYPFGVQPEKGARLVLGSYEMALKPLGRVRLLCKWLQLPAGPEGFYGHYREYEQGIGNGSFRVETQWLNKKKWKATEGPVRELFAPADGKTLPFAGALSESSGVVWELGGYMEPLNITEEEYEYGRVTDGFLRLVLVEPEMGFGHVLYRQLFAEVMMANARRKRPLTPPSLPVSPLLEGVEAGYEAGEELYFGAGARQGRSRVFYLNGTETAACNPVATDRPFALAEEAGSSGALLLGFGRMEGCDRIRFFVEVAPAGEEIDLRDEGTEADAPLWSVRQGKAWKTLHPEAVVRDTTSGFIDSGVVELLLPDRVTEDWQDEEGILWLRAVFRSELIRKMAVKGFYLNVAEVVLDIETLGSGQGWDGRLAAGSITGAVGKIPGVSEVRQLLPGKGGRKKEDEATLNGRVVHRIRHRNRAVTPADYEDLVLEHFPQVVKVKCLPGLDSKGAERKGIVTLVVIPQTEGGKEFPLCTHDLLLDVEHFLQPLAGAHVLIDAVNPLYEEMTVRCRIGVEPGRSAGETILRLRQRIGNLIAPWKTEGGMPVFGYRFGLQELRNVIMEDEGVAALGGLSVLQVCRQGKRLYRLDEYEASGHMPERIGASCAWGIPVPSVNHVIGTGGEWLPESGIGEVEIGRTLVVK